MKKEDQTVVLHYSFDIHIHKHLQGTDIHNDTYLFIMLCLIHDYFLNTSIHILLKLSGLSSLTDEMVHRSAMIF